MAAGDKSAVLKLRRAMLLSALGSVILLLGVFAILGYHNQIKNDLYSADTVIPLLLLTIGAVITLLSAVNSYGGFKIMQNIDRIYNIGRYGSVVQFTEAILLAVGFYLIIFSESSPVQILGLGFTLAGYALGAVCAMPVGIAFYKLGEKYDGSVVKYGAVTYVLIPVIGPTVLYFGLGGIISKL